jgi:hypothetical protein
MVRVLAVVEGPTERNFGWEILASHLTNFDVEFHPRVIGNAGHKGGVGPWERARRNICALIRQEPSAVVTTMFDHYALPTSWPGKAASKARNLTHDAAVALIEGEIETAIRAEFDQSGPPIRFIPYLSQHEFEALLFSGPEEVVDVLNCRSQLEVIRSAVTDCGGCERVNDNPETAPSKRIVGIARRYKKPVDGVTIANRIGLPRIRTCCPHFDSWITRLEQIGKAK